MARELYILVKATELALHSMAEYPMLISAAEVIGCHEVSAVLETILEHRLAFMEQDRRLVRDIIESNITENSRLASLQSAVTAKRRAHRKADRTRQLLKTQLTKSPIALVFPRPEAECSCCQDN